MKPSIGNRQVTFIAVICGLLTEAIYFPIIRRMIESAYDYVIHIRLTAEMITNGGVYTPHFLLQLAVAVLSGISTATLPHSTLIILSTAAITTAYLTARTLLAENPSPLLTTFLTTALMLAAPLAIIFPLDQHLYLGYISPNVFHNPTILLLKPLALISFLYAVKLFDRDKTCSGRDLLCCITTTVACALVKPNFTIAILPALAVATVYRLTAGEHIKLKQLLFGFFLPAVIVLAVQYRMAFSASQLQGMYSGSSSIIFAPLAVMRTYSTWLFSKLILSLAFPLSVLLCFFQAARKNLGLQLSWLAFLCGAAFTYLLAESGPRMYQGNFTWSAQITLFILFIFSAKLLISGECRAIQHYRKRLYLCGTILLGHLLFGSLFYIAEYLQTQIYW